MLRFFRTPKGLLTIVLAIILALAAPGEGFRLLMPMLLATVVAGAVVDLPILRWRKGGWEFPSGAILTGLLIAMVLTPHEPWYVGALTSAFAIISKYVLRTRAANIFNPAALGLVASFYAFDTGQSWWGSLSEVTPLALIVLFALGAFITDRVNKMPFVLAFLGLYYALFTVTAFVGSPEGVAEIFRTPDLNAVLFFAFFILTDPPTSPTKYQDQIICGAIVAVTSYGIFEFVGAAYYLLAGVLIGNVWETWRRLRIARRRARDGSRSRGPVVATEAV